MKETRGYQGNVLLVELIVVVLFFSLAAAISLSVFAKARLVTEEAGMVSRADERLSGFAEELALTADAESYLAQAGFVQTQEAWTLTEDRTTYTAQVERQELSGGVRVRVEIAAQDSTGRNLASLTAGGYFEGGTQP